LRSDRFYAARSHVGLRKIKKIANSEKWPRRRRKANSGKPLKKIQAAAPPGSIPFRGWDRPRSCRRGPSATRRCGKGEDEPGPTPADKVLLDFDLKRRHPAFRSRRGVRMIQFAPGGRRATMGGGCLRIRFEARTFRVARGGSRPLRQFHAPRLRRKREGCPGNSSFSRSSPRKPLRRSSAERSVTAPGWPFSHAFLRGDCRFPKMPQHSQHSGHRVGRIYTVPMPTSQASRRRSCWLATIARHAGPLLNTPPNTRFRRTGGPSGSLKACSTISRSKFQLLVAVQAS